MGFLSDSDSVTSVLSNNSKVVALESTLRQSVENFKELLVDFEELHIQSENYKNQLAIQKEKCQSNCCSCAESLKKVIASKDFIIQLVASNLTKLHDTKNWNILNDTFKILCEDTTVSNPSIKDQEHIKLEDNKAFKENLPISPKKELNSSIVEEISIKEESMCEIGGTPTGRTSPIIQARKSKSIIERSKDCRDKKKSSDNWPTPEKKSLKLSIPTPTRSKLNGKLKQTRLPLTKVKQSCLVDLTCSPELPEGSSNNSSDCTVQPLVKKESLESDDTILPSPTSGPTNFTLFKNTSKQGTNKFKKPLQLKVKTERETKHDLLNVESRNCGDVTNVEMEHSVNILNRIPDRLRSSLKKQSPIKMEVSIDENTTHCDTNSSISLLHHINKLEDVQKNLTRSPAKRPLAENINATNIPVENDCESSMSILRPDSNIVMAAVENVKRKIPELEEPIYKEPTVRKKIEKRALPGWSCSDCENFYGALYKDDPVMLAKKIEECSKHRGRHNPARPKTPPGFWNPRWEVPEDTEELNRMNNAI